MSLSRLIARPLVGIGMAYLAQGTLRDPDKVVHKAASVTDRVVPAIKKAGVPLPDDTRTLVRINAGVQLAGAIAIGTGKAPRLGATMLAVSLAPTTVAGHDFWAESDPAQRKAQTMQFFKNLVMLGGMIIAAGDTDGKPGVAWRTKRAAKDARRQTKQAAKLARAKVG